MSVQDFLAHLPFPLANEPGYINLHWRDKGSNYWSGRATRDANEFIKELTYWSKTGERDFYVCMSRQSEMDERVSKGGYPYKAAVRSTQNATHFSGLWLDLDFKNYRDNQEAAQAFKDFIQQTNLPAPTMYVHSGGGLHIHWILSATIGYDHHRILSQALALSCQKNGLKADTACTVDAARILRLPDTRNYKYDPPRTVRLIHVGQTCDLSRLETPLLPYKVTTPKPVIPNVLAAGITSKPVNVSALISECPFITDALATQGANHDQPQWHITGLLSTFLEDGRNVYHTMSKGHSTYTPQDTDTMYDRKEKEKAAKNLGWPLCKTIHTAGSKTCATCVNFSKGKSPLNFATSPVYVTSKVVKLPDGYRYDPNGLFHVERAVVDKDGVYTWYEIVSWPMYDAWVELSEDSKLHFTSSLQSKPVLVELAIGDIDVREMRRVLQKRGFEIFKKQVDHLGTFLMAWLKELKAQNQFKGNTRSLGWDEDNTNFAYGGQIWSNNGGVSTTASPDVNYIPRGELDPWKRASKLVTDQQRPELNAIIAASFGAPLTTFTGHACWMFSVYSAESGAGKTTAMKTAQAVWGNPSKAMQSLGDTANAVHHKLGRTANMPLFWDEMKLGNAASIKNVGFFLALSGGREKDRLNSNAEAKEVHTWRTILIGANNASMVGFVTNQSKVTDAELMRIIELDVPLRTHGTVSPADASQIIGDLDFNYGKAGEVYAEFIGANVSKIKKDILARAKELEADIGIIPSERFWQANYACLTLGAEYSNALGLTDIDVQSLKDCLRDNIVAMRVSVKEGVINLALSSADIAGLLWDFVSAQGAKHKMVTDHIWTGAGRPTPGYVNALGIPNQILNSDFPFTQIAVNDKLVRVSYSHLSDWLARCSNPSYRDNPPMVLGEMVKHPGVTVLKNAAIGAGAGPGTHCSPNIKVLDFDVNQIPELQQLLDHSAPNAPPMSANVVAFRSP